jgi:negative regulator of genetic competence, sporulation and motility
MKNTRNLRMDFLRHSAYNMNIYQEIFRTVMILELHLIGEDKLKVLLTPFDMMKYNLTCEKLDYENTETRKAIWNILDYAKHETGFDAARGRICIEVFPEKNGGCAIYITKLQANETSEKDGGIELTREKNTLRESIVIYGFEESEALFRVCRFLLSKGYTLPSRAFYEPQAKKKPRYYLEIREAPTASGCKKTKYLRENLLIGEFGTRMEGEISLSYLREHCVPICEENAVNILAPLAN